MTETETLTFAPLTVGDLPAAVALSRAERWPHRPEDWALFLGLGRGVAARVGDRLVGTAMAMPFGPVATACMIIVASEMRGRGLGRRVMEQAMALVAPQEWRLVATEDGLPLYEKLGSKKKKSPTDEFFGSVFGGSLHALPTLLGLWGVNRALELGQDDPLSWVLIL